LAVFLLAAQVAQQCPVTPEKSALTFSTESISFLNPGFSELRPLILFDLQATARGGFQNPAKGRNVGCPVSLLFLHDDEMRGQPISLHDG
jgi:hypothetical protein